MKTVTLRLPDYLAETLPAEESSLREILKLGLKQFRIERAIKRYKKGGVSLAKAAELAGIPPSGKWYLLLMPTDWNLNTMNHLLNPE